MIEPCSFWKNPDDVELACYEWLPPNGEINFIFYLVHGYADFSCAYPKLIEVIHQQGGAVYSHEHFAHGKSGPYPKNHPKRCQIENLYNAARDLNLRVEEIKKKHPNLKCFIHGHSMGGLISTLMVKEYPKCVDGLILEAPAFKLHEATAKWYIILGAKILNWIAPKTKVGGVEFDYISRNIDVNKEKERLYPEYGDCGGMMAGIAVHMMSVQDKLMAQMNQIQVKTLICSGTEDRLTAVSGSEYAHSQIQNSKLKKYNGAYHCLHDELPETTDAFMKDVQEFISALL